MSTFMQAIRFALFTIFATLISDGTQASEHCVSGEEVELATDERIDAFFGDYVVTPLATVMFYDLVFWDNYQPIGHLPNEGTPEEEAGREGPVILGFDKEKKAYEMGCRKTVGMDELRPVIPDGLIRTFGPVEVELREVDGVLMGSVKPTKLELIPYGLEPADPANGPAETDLEVPEAPFAVRVDLVTGMTLAKDVELPWSLVEMAPGSKVMLGDEQVELAAMGSSGQGSVLTGERWESTDRIPVASEAQIQLPAVVFWLVLGAVFFTLRFAFINVRAFVHAILVTMGKYDDPDEPGEVSHFQALSSALSATVGLGNIAGVAIAVTMGGAGAIFWMVVAGVLGMSSKFTECTLGQMYRVVKPDGSVSGGPMHYLSDGLREMNLAPLGKILAVLFAVMCIGGSLGGGNMFQGNQSFQAIAEVAPSMLPNSSGKIDIRLGELGNDVTGPVELNGGPEGDAFLAGDISFVLNESVTLTPNSELKGLSVTAVKGGYGGNVQAGAIDTFSGNDAVVVTNPAPTTGGSSMGIYFGLLMMVAVGLVIIGGIKRIGAAASIIVPGMCAVYVLAGLCFLIAHASYVPSAFMLIVNDAFSWDAGFGGLVGVIITGFRRASFSNEAGIGSASIAHSAAATSEPVREGVVALLEPFIDTVIVCTMTGLVIATALTIPEAKEFISGTDEGIALTSKAFEYGGQAWSPLKYFPYVLAVAVALFAFSTMISWSYYGERAATWLLGDWARTPYKVLFLFCAAMGPVFTLGNVIAFSDLMVLGMAFPNILGLILLSNKVGRALKTYMAKLKAGEFDQAA